MKCVVASVGAVIVTVGAFVAFALIPTVVYPAVYKSIAGVVAIYVIGIPLAVIAGVLSFRGTLRAYANKPKESNG